MLDIVKFIFSSFWIWLGTFMLVAAAGAAFSPVRITHEHKSKDDVE